MEVTIIDSAFMGHSLSASLGEENTHEAPEFIRWVPDDAPNKTTFFTDGQIKTVSKFGRSDRNIAWLLEPHGLRPDAYHDALELEDYFGAVLTFDHRYLHREKWRFYPFGGSWIHPNDWGLREKTHIVSILASQKNTTEGHKLRHSVRYRYLDRIKSFGFGMRVPKLEALAPFMYSVIIESAREEDYFSEKLIDCICVGTVPIYWGSPKITDHFEAEGMIVFQDIDEIDQILVELSAEDYAARLPAIEKNIELAKQYRCAEDRIFRAYPDLFDS